MKKDKIKRSPEKRREIRSQRKRKCPRKGSVQEVRKFPRK